MVKHARDRVIAQLKAVFEAGKAAVSEICCIFYNT
jgi:hypothetical protein